MHGTSKAASVVVNDNDVPVISVSGGSAVTEGTSAAFTLSISPAPHQALTVNIGRTQTGSYLTATSNFTVSVSAGATTKDFTIATTDDSNDEDNGSVTATVKSGTGYNVHGTNNSAEVAVNDNDVPVISITAGRVVTEGGNATFTVSATPTPVRDLTVNVTVTQTGAFVASANLGSKTVTVPTSGSVTLTVATVGDTTDEANGSVTATVNAGTGYNVHASTNAASVTVNDDDATPTVTLTLTPDSINENGGSTTVTASLNRPSSHQTTITVSASVVSPVVAGDFSLSTDKTLTIAAGATTSSGTVTITAVDNSVDAANKSVTVSGSASNTQGVSGPSDVTLTIEDDESSPTVTLALSSTSIGENGGTTTVTATLNRASSQRTTITVTATEVSPAVAGDFSLSTDTTLTIAAGATTSTGTVTITTNDNNVDAPNKTVTVSGSASNTQGVINPSNVTLTITDDDAAPTVTLHLVAAISENGGSANVTASLNHPSSEVTRITVAVAAGSNTTNSHFNVSTNKILNIAAEETTSTGTVTITAVDDSVSDSNQKSVDVSATATNSQGINSSITSRNLKISDDETTPTLSISPSPASADEGETIVFTVTMSITTSAATTLTTQIDIADTDLVNPAQSTDYTLVSASATIAAGSSSATFTVNTTEDTQAEPNEQFRFVVDGTTGSKTIATAKALGTIRNDDMLEIPTTPGRTETIVGDHTVTVDRAANVPESVELQLPAQPTADLTVTIREAVESVARQSPLFRVDKDTVVDIDVQGLAGQSVTICMDAPADSEMRRAAERAGKPLQIARYENGKWNPLESTDDGSMVCTDVASFSPFSMVFEFSLSATSAVLEHALATLGSNMLTSAIENIRTQFDAGLGSGGDKLVIAGHSVPIIGNGQEFEMTGNFQGAACGPLPSALHFGRTPSGWAPRVSCRTDTLFGDVSQNRFHSLSNEELIANSSFVLSESEPDVPGVSSYRWSTWGRGDYINFRRSAGEPATYDGSLKSIYMGVDARTDEWLAGIAVARTSGQMNFTQDDGLLETRVTALHPYGKWQLLDDIETWAILGIGSGKAERSQPDAALQSADLRMIMAATGLRQTRTTAKGLEVATRADASGIELKTGASEGNLGNLRASSWKVRAGLEVSKRQRLVDGSEVTSYVGFMGRYDGGDGETGSGVEVTGRLRYEKDRHVVETRLRKLAVYSDSDYDEWGASVGMSLSPHNDGSGFSASLTHSWGVDEQSTDRLWADQPLSLIGSSNWSARNRTNMRIGYGVPLTGSSAVLTPFAEVGVQDTLQSTRVGFELASKRSDVYSELFYSVREREYDKPDRAIMFTLSARF